MRTRTPAGWVLVVDDDATDRMAAFRLLEREGHHATVADAAASALDLLRTEPFDLVLVDLDMPEPDGYALLSAMNDDPVLRHVPVIGVSTLGGTDSVRRCVDLGAEDHLAKPFDPVLFRIRVNASLTRKHLRDGQAEYLDAVNLVADAAGALGDGGFDPATLDHVARRADPLGRLARLVQQLGGSYRRSSIRLPSSGPVTTMVPSERTRTSAE